MNERDFDDFAAMLDDVRTLLPSGSPALSATAKAMFFRAMAAFDLAAVRRAMDAHVRDPQRGRFAPTPADLIAQIEGASSADGRPGPEEAWALAIRAADESETVVWTAEMSQAWALASTVFARGDEVGARMAFREAYARLVAEARAARAPVRWNVSLGHDAERRAVAIESAVKAGRLPQSELAALPGPVRGGNVLSLPAPTVASAKARQRLRELADKLRNGPPPAPMSVHERAAELKAKAAQAVSEYSSIG